jgi:bifunctional UDP-N-acetylglucosamine pyrophosphorylase/glucosamine-1-phosphate N-acetyltransferase
MLVERHVASGAAVTMLTVPLPDFKEWRSSFADWGRIIRDASGAFVKSVEAKDATVTELGVTEVNPSLYCFRRAWLLERLPAVRCENVQGEYYLPDVLGLTTGGERVETVQVEDPRETLGANTPEQLAVLERVYADVKERWKADGDAVDD